MRYKILSVSAAGDTLNTEVEISFKDNTTTVVVIPHFRPDDKQAVIDGIEARVKSEESGKNARETIVSIVAVVSPLIGNSVKI